MADKNLKNQLINKRNEDGAEEEASSSNENKNAKKKIKYSLDSSDKEVSQSETLARDAYEPHCPICLEEFKNKSYPTVCRHEFCFSCLKKWANSVRNECPLCNQRFTSIVYNIESDSKFDTYSVENCDDPDILNTGLLELFEDVPDFADEVHVDPFLQRSIFANPPERERESHQVVNDLDQSVRDTPNNIRRFDEPASSTSTSNIRNTKRFPWFVWGPNEADEMYFDPFPRSLFPEDPPERITKRIIESRQMMNASQRSSRDASNSIRGRYDQPEPSSSTSKTLNTETFVRFGYAPNMEDESHEDPFFPRRISSVDSPKNITERNMESRQMTNASQLSVRNAPNKTRIFEEPGTSTSSKILNTERCVQIGYAPNVTGESHVDPPQRNIETETESRQMMNAPQRSITVASNNIRRFDEPGSSTSTFTDSSTETSNHALNESSEIESPSYQEEDECQVVQSLNPRCILDIFDLSSDDEI